MSNTIIIFTIIPCVLLFLVTLELRRLHQQLDQDRTFLPSRSTINCNIVNQLLNGYERFDEFIENRLDDGTLGGKLSDLYTRNRVAQLNEEITWTRIYTLQ